MPTSCTMYDEATARKMLQEAVLVSAEDAEDGRRVGRLRPERRGAGQVLPRPASWKQDRCFILHRRGIWGCAVTCLLWICIDVVEALPSDIRGLTCRRRCTIPGERSKVRGAICRNVRGVICQATCLLWICIDGVGALPSDIGGQVSEPSPAICL